MSPTSEQWLSLVGTIWLQTVNGANSDFPVYSSQLKQLLSISQIQLNNLAFASDAGKLLGWLSGIAAIYLPLWLVLVIGAALGFVGYGVQFLFLINKIRYLSYWQVFMLTVLAGNSICWINTVCYLICIRNFSSACGIAVGISTSYVGLTAKVYTVIIDAIFNPLPNQKAKFYLFLNSIAPVIITVITIPFVRISEMKKKEQRNCGFTLMLIITITTGIYAILGSIGSTSKELSPRDHMLTLGSVLVAPLLVPVVMKYKGRMHDILKNRRENRVHDEILDEGNTEQRVSDSGDAKDERIVSGEDNRSIEVCFKVLLRKLNFWLYFFSYMFGATLGLVFLNNLGQIAESRGLSRTSSLVSLSSSFGFFGRLIPSLLDYFLSKSRYSISKPASMAALMAPMAGSFFLLMNSSSFFLYISTAVIGTCTGAITSIAVATTSELFGTKNFGVNHNIVVANIPLGSFLFGYSAAVFYQREEVRGSQSCIGSRCYNQTFLIWGSICSLGTLLCTLLYIRTRKMCIDTDNSHDDSRSLDSQV